MADELPTVESLRAALGDLADVYTEDQLRAIVETIRAQDALTGIPSFREWAARITAADDHDSPSVIGADVGPPTPTPDEARAALDRLRRRRKTLRSSD